MDHKGWIIIFILLGILLGVAYSISLTMAAMGLLGVIYLGICFLSPRKGILLTLFLRASMDAFTSFTLTIPGLGQLNIASIMGILIVVLAFFLLMTGEIKGKSPLTVPIMAFVTVITASVITTAFKSITLTDCLKFFSLISMYMIIYEFSTKDKSFMSQAIDCTVFSSVIPLLVGLYEFFSGSGNQLTEGLNRIDSTFVHPNPYAFYLVVVIIACYIKISSRGVRNSILYLPVILLSLLELIFTYTRGAWLGLTLTFGLLVFNSKNRFKYLTVFGSLGLICAFFFADLIVSRFQGLFSSQMEVSSLATRLFIWTNMLRHALQSPVIGYGLGTFKTYAGIFMNYPIEAHNEYLRMFFEVGALGLLTYLYLIYRYLMESRKKIRESYSLQNVLILNLLLSFAVMSFGDNIASNLVSQWYLWVLLAVSHTSVTKDEKEYALEEETNGMRILIR